MSKTSEDQAIRTAWGDLCYIADTWDWTAPRLLHEAEKAEQRDARGAGINYPKVKQLADLCETALKPPATLAGLYQLRTGHRDVAIVAATMAERLPERYTAWCEAHGGTIRAYRRAPLAAE